MKEKPPVTKSMLASKNLPQPIVSVSQGHHWIRVLAAELALRLREARESIPALWPRSIVLHIRQGVSRLVRKVFAAHSYAVGKVMMGFDLSKRLFHSLVRSQSMSSLRRETSFGKSCSEMEDQRLHL